MTLGSWALYALLTMLAAGFVGWLYLRREPPGRGRLLLAGLRMAAFAVVLLLIFDPGLRRAPGNDVGSRTHLLVDASASMALPQAPDDSTARWAEALAQARNHAGPIMLFGDVARPVETLPDAAPGDSRSRLLPALRAAAEAGAERVVVVTDGAIEDAEQLSAWLPRLGLGIEWRRAGTPLTDLAIEDVQLPGWAASGEPVDLEVTLAASGMPGDSVTVLVRQDGRTIGQARAAVPADGRSSRISMPVRPTGPEAGGFVQLEVSLDQGDVIPANDRRLRTLFVSADPAGVVVLSLQPDWEPRFLLPVLGSALGVPARGFLHTGTGWVRIGAGAEAGGQVTEGAVAEAARQADLLVLHGLGTEAAPWVRDALGDAQRLLILPGARTEGLSLPVTLTAPLADDWFVAADVPASPVAPLLADAVTPDAPPLASLRGAAVPEGVESWVPLEARRGRLGQSAPLLVVGSAAGRRWAVALGEGYWRWAFRGGEPRQLYDRLWASVAGWLMREQAGRGVGVRPVERVVSRGDRSRWLVPGTRVDSLRLRIAGAATLDTALFPVGSDTLVAPVLPPGSYQYEARAWSGAGTIDGSGQLTVESWSPELVRPVHDVAAIEPARRIETSHAAGTPRPLHTLPFPYILVVLLLATEWILRRRWGLR